MSHRGIQIHCTFTSVRMKTAPSYSDICRVADIHFIHESDSGIQRRRLHLKFQCFVLLLVSSLCISGRAHIYRHTRTASTYMYVTSSKSQMSSYFKIHNCFANISLHYVVKFMTCAQLGGEFDPLRAAKTNNYEKE